MVTSQVIEDCLMAYLNVGVVEAKERNPRQKEVVKAKEDELRFTWLLRKLSPFLRV